MSEIINYDKVTAVLLQHGEWYEIEPETLTAASATNFWAVTLEPVHLLGKATAPVTPVHATHSFSTDTQNNGLA